MSFSENIRKEQMMGTLEAMLVTPTKTSTIIVSMSLWSFIFASISIVIYLLLGRFLFGISFQGANFLAAGIILLLTIISFSCLGIISAGFIMIFKKGLPFNWLISSSFQLLGGIYYPITILPKSLQVISHLLPITYSLRSLRLALLQRYPTAALTQDIFALSIFCIVLLPISILFFRFTVRRAKIGGSLSHY